MSIDQEKRLDLLIDQALQDFQVDPTPEDLMSRIMERIEKPLPWGSFKINWFDFAFSGVLALIAGFVLDFFQGVARSPYWANRARVVLIQIGQNMKYFFLHNYQPVMTVVLSSVLVLTLIVVLASVYRRYTLYSNRLPA